MMVSCGSAPQQNTYPTRPEVVGDTTLGSGDIFEVRVFRQKDMSGQYAVSSEGTISFPLIGLVEVRGKTAAQVEEDIRRRLADGYLKHPQVSIFVKEFKSKKVSVFGQVRKPGTLGFSEGMTIVEALSKAGGFTDMARKNAVTVTRNLEGQTRKYTLPVEKIGQGRARTFYMRPGDVVFVSRRWW